MEPARRPADESSANPTGDSDAAGAGGNDPFAAFKTIVARDCIRMKVPAIWPSAWNEKAGMWCCCEDLEAPALDTGTFWIDVDVLDLGSDAPASGAAGPERALQAMAQRIGQKKQMSGGAPGDAVTLRDMPGGKVISYRRPADSATRKFAEHRWHSLTLRDGRLVVAHYSLFTPSS